MATTQLMPLHIGKGRTAGTAIAAIIDYVKNPGKTDNGRLITSWQCDSRVADSEFLFSKQQYIRNTGRVRGADDVIAYHLRQSFRPGEITPEETNRLGCELVRRFTKGNHAYIVCTHIDKTHVHLPSSSRTNNQYDKQKILNMLLIHDLGESVVGDIIPAYERYEESREKERIFCEELFLQGVHPNIANLSEYFFLWEAWCDSSHDDYNILIAREIDKIQMLYKMLFLLSKNRVNLTGRRIEDFWKAKNCIRTKEGKRIFNILIAQDIELKVVAEKHNLSVSELK